ncbi:MAG: Gfo/Idh/MocA family oxidoreductase [Spirochaetales bacterium]|nr:Gfo/Idh/MocA family oxidoreductase [Spirochaetales bacterium]
MKKPITAVLIGAGQRGADVYGSYALKKPEDIRIIAVAEPDKEKREGFTASHSLPPDSSLTHWKDLLAKGKIADVAIIATPDEDHVEPALSAMTLGYHVLLEKPIAKSALDCMKIVNQARKTDRILQIAHVLRYTHFYSTIQKVITSGEMGRIANFSLRENVAYYHYAHSYSRGNWHNRDIANPMILAKCCHDLDLMRWFSGSKALHLSSFGNRKYFGPANRPHGAPERCTDGCPVQKDCLYDAVRIYLEEIPLNKNIWPASVISRDQSREGRLNALKEGPYGLCVFNVKDHNVVDHQIVNCEFANGITGTLTMHGFSHKEGRTIRIDGTKGTLIGDFLADRHRLTFYTPLNKGEKILIDTKAPGGHGGGDQGLLKRFTDLVRNQDTRANHIDIDQALEAHILAFAADSARLENRVVDMENYKRELDSIFTQSPGR